ncbi:predicted protein [Botrytis cinerea T4]|uniref:Uncharacterized protein n=1 Tax=Botryotinia fuckeliana (strain T4) TaxID=999810 RepID=G2YGH0_BOTF4|nr:predicted protein [Botrytis cinerea T4]
MAIDIDIRALNGSSSPHAKKRSVGYKNLGINRKINGSPLKASRQYE